MKKIKLDILQTATELFNQKGVANVSIREISRELGISHSHLIYHFKTKNILIEALHQQMFQHAINLNREIKQASNPLEGLFESTMVGFQAIYTYRFFMVDLNLIIRENPSLHLTFLEVEKARFSMYKEQLEEAVEGGWMKAEHTEKNENT